MIVKYLREKKLENIVSFLPDPGGMEMALQLFPHKLYSGLAIVAKQRTSPSEVEVFNLVVKWKEKRRPRR